MSREVLVAETRDASGKSPVARRLRKSGRVPGVLYKRGESAPFSADALDVAAVLRHGATLIDVKLDGDTHACVIKDYQVHPVRSTVQHIDLQEVRMDERVKSTVSVQLVGESPGVKSGGVLTVYIHTINIESTPLNIPETLDVDISGVATGDTLHLSDLVVPEGVQILDDPELTLLNISVPRGQKGAAGGDGTDSAADGGDEGVGEEPAADAPAAE